MGWYSIKGGNKITGSISPGGAKNAVLPILAATVLNGGKNVIHNAPAIADTFITLEIMRALGCTVSFRDGTITVDSSVISSTVVPKEQAESMRSSILFMGSMLAKPGQITIYPPGGCELGSRNINFHLESLIKMGAEIYQEDKCAPIVCSARKLHGKEITFPFPSVGATENVLLASVLAEGKTVINNAAMEPEIADLADFLSAMGADIKGAGTRTVVINGVKKLSGAEHTIIPDRIVAGTYLCASAVTGGEILVQNARPSHMEAITDSLSKAGCVIKQGSDFIWLKAPVRLAALGEIVTGPHPAFPTDMQPQFTVLQCVSMGSCTIKETVFDKRNKHASMLTLMGADIHTTDDENSLVNGVEKLTGAEVEACDLRCGAALILAGLAAEGETVVKNSHHVERGYHHIEDALSSLGADIAHFTADDE